MSDDGKPYCDDCPDREACMTGMPCAMVKAANAEPEEEARPDHLDIQMTHGYHMRLQITPDTEVSLSENSEFLVVSVDDNQLGVPIRNIAYWVQYPCNCEEKVAQEASDWLRNIMDGGGGEPPTS